MRVSTRPTGSARAASPADALERALLDPLGGARLVVVEGEGAARLLARLARGAEGAGAWGAAGRCDARLAAPLGPFPELLADVARALAPAGAKVLERHGMTLATLLAGHPGAVKPAGPPFRAGLADFALRGDAFGLREFFQGRNVSYRVVDDVVRFLLDASRAPPAGVSGPLVLCVDRLEAADPLSLSVLRLLGRYAPGHPLRVVVAAAPGTAPPGAEWERVSLVAEGEVEPDLSPPARALLAAASLAPGWIAPEALAELAASVGAGAAHAAELAAAGLLVDWGARGHAVPGGAARRVAEALPAGEARAHHARLAALRPERASLFARALHRSEGEVAGWGEAELEASVAAWNLSAYPQAAHHAARAFSDPACAAAHDADVFLALLHYEAGDARACDTHLRAALERAAEPFQHSLLNRLAGYNGVFGLKEHAYGLELLTRARDFLRGAGRLRDVGWIQNAMAFALMSLRRPEEATALEEESLAMARSLPNADRYLVAILQLNLGRLHRKRSLDDAVGYFRQSLRDAEGQVDAMLLVLFYLTLGNVYASHDRPADALSYYRRAADVGMDRDLGGFSDRLFALTSHVFPALVADEPRVLRVDAARLHLSLLMASAYRRLGAPAQALRHEGWVDRQLGKLGIDERPPVDEAPVTGLPVGAGAAGEGFEARLALHPDQVASRRPAAPGDEVARLLAAGESVAVLVPALDGVPGEMESLVLFDPRGAGVRARLLHDLGRTAVAGGVVALPGAAAFFEGAEAEFPCAVQEVSLAPEHAAEFAGVAPVRTRVRFVPEEGGTLRRALEGFEARTGIPFLGALALQVAGEEIAHDGTLALKYFLETAIDHLLVDGVLVEKRHGADAPENLLPLRPRLLSTAHLVGSGAGGEQTVLVVRRKRIRVGSRGAEILPLCDGATPVARIVDVVGSGEEVDRFLHGLRGQNALHYAS